MENISIIYSDKNSLIINKIKNIHKSILIYNNSPKLFLDYNKIILKTIIPDKNLKKCKICKELKFKLKKNVEQCLTKILATITCSTFILDKDCFKIKNCEYNISSRMGFLFLENGKIIINKNIIIDVIPGLFVVFGEEIVEQNSFIFPKNTISFHDVNIFNIINSRIILRLSYFEKINYIIERYKKNGEWKQCFETEVLGKNIINSGGFGMIRKIVKNRDDIFILKLSSYDIDFYYTLTESFVLKYICNDIINKKLCPNVPYTFEIFSCDNCTIKTSNNKIIKNKCLINCAEYGNSDFTTYLEKINNPSKELLNSLLFQIMAGLHTLQHHYQTCHFDIKAPNILIYNVTPGGFWKYTIYGKDYYVPNYGALAIINDFGMAKTFRAEYKGIQPFYNFNVNSKLISFGTRFGTIENSELLFFDDQEILDTGINFIKKRKGYELVLKIEENDIIKKNDKESLNLLIKPEKIILEKKITEFINNPKYPLLEFYNDTQDVIRMFVSDGTIEMTAQKINHENIENISKNFKDNLFCYVWQTQNLYKNDKNKFFDGIPEEYPLYPEIMFAGSFISHYFKNVFTKIENDILENYKIS